MRLGGLLAHPLPSLEHERLHDRDTQRQDARNGVSESRLLDMCVTRLRGPFGFEFCLYLYASSCLCSSLDICVCVFEKGRTIAGRTIPVRVALAKSTGPGSGVACEPENREDDRHGAGEGE